MGGPEHKTIYYLVKKCSKCKIEKTLDCFHNNKQAKYGKSCTCKNCAIKRSRTHYKENKDHHLESAKKRREEKPEEIRRKKKEWYENNKEYSNERMRRYYAENKERILSKNKEYRINNKEKLREKQTEYQRYKRNNCEYTKANCALRNMLRNTLKGNFKSGATVEMLGYTAVDLKTRMEAQFTDGMTWSNHGEWHIEHKIPVDYFLKKGEERPHIINALSNLQPMWAEENYQKSNKLTVLERIRE